MINSFSQKDLDFVEKTYQKEKHLAQQLLKGYLANLHKVVSYADYRAKRTKNKKSCFGERFSG